MTVAVPTASRMRRQTTRSAVANRWGWLMVSPYLVHLLLFTAGPILAALYFSFCRYEVIQAPRWLGTANYTRMVGDKNVRDALSNSIFYIITFVPSSMVISLAVALALNQRIRGMSAFRALFFLPVVSSGVGIALLWSWLLNKHGLVNHFVTLVGFKPINFFGFQWALKSVVIMSVWSSLGSLMVYWLAGLQGVPQELYEAAQIDGAGAWQRFRRVTVPFLTPVAFFLVVMGVIGSFQVFTATFIMTGGGPGNATLTIALYIYQRAFIGYEMGYAAALAYLLFAILSVITFMQWRLQSKWVFYQ
ncbi:MAG: carbohydrate ABC transporter permease [Anaerolineae bacterium]